MVSPVPSIPGLISIETETLPEGGTRIIFEVDDGQVEQFFSAFGVDTGDVGALQDTLIKALQWAVQQREDRADEG